MANSLFNSLTSSINFLNETLISFSCFLSSSVKHALLQIQIFLSAGTAFAFLSCHSKIARLLARSREKKT